MNKNDIAARDWGAYAGVWRRVLAWCLDGIVAGALGLVVVLVLRQDIAASATPGFFVFVVETCVALVYFGVLEGVGPQASLGKQVVGIHVAKVEGGLSASRAPRCGI